MTTPHRYNERDFYSWLSRLAVEALATPVGQQREIAHDYAVRVADFLQEQTAAHECIQRISVIVDCERDEVRLIIAATGYEDWDRWYLLRGQIDFIGEDARIEVRL